MKSIYLLLKQLLFNPKLIFFNLTSVLKNYISKVFQSTFIKNHGIFIWVISIGLILRLLFIEFQGLSNDELSAWYRLRFNDWNSFWYYGVKFGDMHPVFYQAFMYFWVNIFGDSEIALRSTGLFFYLLNSLFIYKICIRYFSKNTGLAILVVYSTLVFTIINTSLARPYNSGTFFLLFSFWSILEIHNGKKKISIWHLFLTLSFLGAMTSHYFAFLTAGIIGFLSLFYLPKSKRIGFLISGTLSILLFLPHWSVTEFHLNKGGLGWLPPPDIGWLPQTLFQIFNNSWFILITIIAALLFIHFKVKVYNKEEKLAIAIFSITYIISHVISIIYTPILRELVLLYLLPFLLFFLFRNIDYIKHIKIIFLVLPLIFGVHSIFVNGLLKSKHFGVFREIGNEINILDANNILKESTIASNYNNIAYLNYYLNNPLKESIKDWSSGEVIYELADKARNSNKKYFLYSWSNSFHIPMYYEVIQKYFPSIIDGVSYFGSSFRLFSKTNNRILSPVKGIIPASLPIVTSDEFFGEINLSVEKLKMNEDQYILLKAKGKLTSKFPVYFVATLERDGEMVKKNKQALFYTAFDQSKLCETNKLTDFFIAFRVPEEALSSDIIKIYFWNPEKVTVEVQKVELFYQKS